MVSAGDFRDIFEYNWQVLRDFCDGLTKLPDDALRKHREATHLPMKTSSTSSRYAAVCSM